jgi:hypothetical protein
MKTKELIKKLKEGHNKCLDLESGRSAYLTFLDKETIATVIKFLQHYETLKEDYDRLSNIINGISELVDSSFTDHPI